MVFPVHILVCFAGSVLLLASSVCGDSSPVVGVLTQPRTTKHNRTEYYIAASYLKWLELAGARAIPIPYDAPVQLVDELFSQVSGILFPGGGSDVPDAARHLWQLSLESNQNGEYFPIWGTCLGFEYIVIMASSASDQNIMQAGFDAENVSLPLEQVGRKHSRLYADPVLHRIVTTKNVTLNNHHIGVEPSTFEQDERLMDMFYITSINHDRQGRPFVSTIEPKLPDLYPFYGVQYHPEKNPFEYATLSGIPFESIDHSSDGIYYSVSLAQFFGRLLQKSLQNGTHEYNQFERHPLVYSYPMKRGAAFEQVFIVPPANHWLVPLNEERVGTQGTSLRGSRT